MFFVFINEMSCTNVDFIDVHKILLTKTVFILELTLK